MQEEAWAQPRPMLGRLPWFAFERRMRAFFFFVFFDMGPEVSGGPLCFLDLGTVERHEGPKDDEHVRPLTL